MPFRDAKIKQTLLENGLGLLGKEYEKNPSNGNTRVHDNMVPWALRALGTKTKEWVTELSPGTQKTTVVSALLESKRSKIARPNH